MKVQELGGTGVMGISRNQEQWELLIMGSSGNYELQEL